MEKFEEKEIKGKTLLDNDRWQSVEESRFLFKLVFNLRRMV